MGQHSSDKLSLAASRSRGLKIMDLSGAPLPSLLPCYLRTFSSFRPGCELFETRVGTLPICIPSKLSKAYSMGGAQ